MRTKFPNLSKSTSGTSLWKLLKRSALVFHCNLLKYKTVSPYQLWNWFQDSVFFWMNVISWVKINWCREGGCGKQHIGKQKGEQSFTFSTFTNISNSFSIFNVVQYWLAKKEIIFYIPQKHSNHSRFFSSRWRLLF